MALVLDQGFPKGDVDFRNFQMIDALEFVDQVIDSYKHEKISVWRTMIPVGEFPLGQGLIRKKYRFHPGLADQRGLQRWSLIQISSVGNPGFDACKYNPYKVTFGTEEVTYRGHHTERSTDPICVRDLRFTWQFQQQLQLIYEWLGEVTHSVWENWARENYIQFAALNQRCYVMAGGSPNGVQFSYDPYFVDADGDNVITLPITSGQISTLNWSSLRWWHRNLMMDAPMAAVGTSRGFPTFGAVLDLEDWQWMIEQDAALREDWRYYDVSMLVKMYGAVTEYKGYALMHDQYSPRWAVKSATATTVTLKRVDPYIELQEVKDYGGPVEGNRVEVNPDYLNAEFGTLVIYLKDVLKREMPMEGPANPGGGTSFGTKPSYYGEFFWLNIAEDNRLAEHLREIGRFFARFEAFARPMRYDDKAVVIIYRRCPQVIVTGCDYNDKGNPDEAGRTEEVSLLVDAADGDIVADGSGYQFTLTLAKKLDQEPLEKVTIEDNSTNTAVGYIVNSEAAPTYVFSVPTIGSLSTTYTDYTAAGAASVTGI